MAERRLLAALGLAGMLCGGLCGHAGLAAAQGMAATPGPQQMMPSGVPAAYPYPSLAGPAAAQMPMPPTQPFGPPLPAMAPSIPGGLSPSAPGMPGDLGPAAAPPAAFDAAADPNPFGSGPNLDNGPYMERSLGNDESLSWQLLPAGLMYRSYLAGDREPRISSQWVHLRDLGWRWDATLGGRVGLLRYGTNNDLWPQGWQIDVEAAAFPRLDLEHLRDLDAVDFRAGVPITTRQGPFETKFGYYHLSSHIGDEYLLRFPDFPRINYVREALMLGMAVYLNPSLRLYSEVDYSFYVDGGALPWEFQFGADFSSIEPSGFGGAPFFAVNGHLRQENDFGGNVTLQTGWQWRGYTGHLCRIGLQYFNGMSDSTSSSTRSRSNSAWASGTTTS